MPSHRPPDRTRFVRFTRIWFLLLGAALAHAAGDGTKKIFNLAADTADRSIKAFSEQSGRGVIFVTDAVKGVRTNLLKGEFTPGEALETLLRGTGLVSSNDAETGAFAVRRATPEEAKNGQRVGQKTSCDRPRIPNFPTPSKIPQKT